MDSEILGAKIAARELCDKIAQLIIEYENRHHNALAVVGLTVSRVSLVSGSRLYDVGAQIELLSTNAVVRSDDGNHLES